MKLQIIVTLVMSRDLISRPLDDSLTPLSFTAVISFLIGLLAPLISQSTDRTPPKGHHRLSPIGSSCKMHSNVSSIPPLIFTGVKECEAPPRFLARVAFESLCCRKGAAYRKSTVVSGAPI